VKVTTWRSRPPTRPALVTALGRRISLSISTAGLISGTPTTAGTSIVTVTATDGTGASGDASSTWTISGPGTTGTRHVTYTTTSQWPGGFTANAGDQKITASWNTATNGQSGEAVTLTNASYNGSIAAGASTTIGFQGTWTSSDAAPTVFTVNGSACS
jgi:hypothetical protein